MLSNWLSFKINRVHFLPSRIINYSRWFLSKNVCLYFVIHCDWENGKFELIWKRSWLCYRWMLLFLGFYESEPMIYDYSIVSHTKQSNDEECSPKHSKSVEKQTHKFLRSNKSCFGLETISNIIQFRDILRRFMRVWMFFLISRNSICEGNMWESFSIAQATYAAQWLPKD